MAGGSEGGRPPLLRRSIARGHRAAQGRGYVAGVRVAIVEGAGSPGQDEVEADGFGIVLADGREFWLADDLGGLVIVEADGASYSER